MVEECITFLGSQSPAHDRYETPTGPYLVRLPWKGLEVQVRQLHQEFLQHELAVIAQGCLHVNQIWELADAWEGNYF